MKFRSVEGYVQHVGRMLRALHNRDHVITDSLQTHWALQATKRVLGDTMQRARPITLQELKMACVNVKGPQEFVLAFRVIALVAWFAAMRLGQLLPQSAGQNAVTMTLRDLELSEDGQAVLVSSSRSKTNVFRAKTRKIAVSACDVDPALCLRTSLTALWEFRRLRNSPLDVPLWSLHEKVATFDKFVNAMQELIAPKASTAFEKGIVTGHSFRRGFTKAALLAGFSIEQIMLHGDWSHPDSVINSYGAGAILPSIPMARHAGVMLSGAGSFVGPAFMPPLTRVSVSSVDPPGLSAGNPFKSVAVSGTAVVNVALLARQACQWEFDMGYLSCENPFQPRGGEAQAGTDATLSLWLKKRARQWELENNKELVDLDSKKTRT